MVGLPRFWLRQLFKLTVGLAVLTTMVIVSDVYLNFLPTSVQAKLPLYGNSDVVLDLKVRTCVTLSGCLSEESGGWYRVPKDLYLQKSWVTSGFVYARRVSQDELEGSPKVVLDAALGNATHSGAVPAYVQQDVAAGAAKSGMTSNKESMRPEEVDEKAAAGAGWERKEGGLLWVKYGKHVPGSTISAIDVLFGSDAADPRPGWRLLDGTLLADSSAEPRLTVRKGPRVEVKRPTLKAGANGRFKILQLADMHFSTGPGKCVDTVPAAEGGTGCEADPRTLELVESVLDREKPDLVVFTGDQLLGESAPDPVTALYKVYAPVIQRKIPHATVFGNHDDIGKGALSREHLMEAVSRLPYNLAEPGPAAVDGVGNYVLQVQAPKSDHPAITLYFLDSHKYTVPMQKPRRYDHIKQSQIDWVEAAHRELKPRIDEFSHIPLAMAFQHIPLPEYRNAGNKWVGSYPEGCTAPWENSGARDAYARAGVSVVSVGHDHANDFCMYDESGSDNESPSKIMLCYGGAVGEGGYGGYGDYIRRVRLFEIDTQSGSIVSYKYKRNDPESFDRQTLVANGAPVPIA